MVDDAPSYRLRVRIFAGVVLVVMGVLLIRLFALQVLEHRAFEAEVHSTSVRARALQPARGAIYDRHGHLLVDNATSFTLMVTPYLFDQQHLAWLAGQVAASDSLLRARIAAARAWNPYRPSAILHGIPFETFSRIEEVLYRLRGVAFAEEQVRRYHGVRGAHLFGYLGEIDAGELERLRDKGYTLGDAIGKTGLERTYEPFLRGTPGVAYEVVGIRGQVIEPYRRGEQDVNPVSGYDLHLALDGELQVFAESLFVRKRGAAVALDPRDGGVLAFVSAPDYDPALLAGTIRPELWRALNTDPHRPLFNRALLSGQPTGSTIKPFMSLVGLAEGVIDAQTVVYCRGGFYFGGRLFRDHIAHGAVTVRDALRVSCNVFFYTLMMRMNFAHWSAWGHRFGFGEPLPLDLGRQSAGLWPDSAYFNQTYGRHGWTRGYLVSLGIGQGDLSVTPMQLAQYVAALANGGTRYAPHAVHTLHNPDTDDRRTVAVAPAETLSIDPHAFTVVREGMRRVVEAGTGRIAQIDGVAVAGKTGTAENPHGRDHSLFIAFAPYENPQIALAVFVENGGFGASAAAPMASLMMEKYLTGRIAPGRQALLRHVLHDVRSEGM